jgi:hypothetical protein
LSVFTLVGASPERQLPWRQAPRYSNINTLEIRIERIERTPTETAKLRKTDAESGVFALAPLQIRFVQLVRFVSRSWQVNSLLRLYTPSTNCLARRLIFK